MEYKTPDWLYLPANINLSLLSRIQAELLTLFEVIKALPLSSDNALVYSTAIGFDMKKFVEYCPILYKELQGIKIADFLDNVIFVLVRPHGPDVTIHRDYRHNDISFGLNIPVMNCQQSFTVWYDAKLDYFHDLPDFNTGGKFEPHGYPAYEETAVEIDRVKNDLPYWINNSVPHAPRGKAKEIRINSSLRFNRNIYKMLEDGTFYNLCVDKMRV